MRNTVRVVIVLPIFIAAATAATPLCFVFHFGISISFSLSLLLSIERSYTQKQNKTKRNMYKHFWCLCISNAERERGRGGRREVQIESRLKVVMNLFHFGYCDLMRCDNTASASLFLHGTPKLQKKKIALQPLIRGDQRRQALEMCICILANFKSIMIVSDLYLFPRFSYNNSNNNVYIRFAIYVFWCFHK